MKTNISQNQIVIYEHENKKVSLNADIKKETIWARQIDILNIFDIDQSVVSRHIKNIFKDKELNLKSNMQKMHIPNSDKTWISI